MKFIFFPNFILNLFILYFYLLSFLLLFSSRSSTSEWAREGSDPTNFISLPCRLFVCIAIFQFSSALLLHRFVYLPFPSPSPQRFSSFSTLQRWLSLFFIKLGVFPQFSIWFSLHMHEIDCSLMVECFLIFQLMILSLSHFFPSKYLQS